MNIISYWWKCCFMEKEKHNCPRRQKNSLYPVITLPININNDSKLLYDTLFLVWITLINVTARGSYLNLPLNVNMNRTLKKASSIGERF